MDDFTPSVFDRLTDPALAAGGSTYPLTRLRDVVLRDLRTLLDARRPPDPATAGVPHVAASVFNFGLRDQSHEDPASGEFRERYREHVQDVIAAFEPRLTKVTVTVRPADEVKRESKDGFRIGNVYLRISCTLGVHPVSVDGVLFETALDSKSGRHTVTHAGA